MNTEDTSHPIDPGSGELAFHSPELETLEQLAQSGQPVGVEQINNLVVRETINSLIRRVSDLEDQINTNQQDQRHEMRSFLVSLLRVGDSLDRILKLTDPDNEVFASLSALRNLFLQILEDRDVYVVEITAGDDFDPVTCEVSGSEERPDLAPDTILSVERRGYLWGEKTLRRARVVIAIPARS